MFGFIIVLLFILTYSYVLKCYISDSYLIGGYLSVFLFLLNFSYGNILSSRFYLNFTVSISSYVGECIKLFLLLVLRSRNRCYIFSISAANRLTLLLNPVNYDYLANTYPLEYAFYVMGDESLFENINIYIYFGLLVLAFVWQLVSAAILKGLIYDPLWD